MTTRTGILFEQRVSLGTPLRWNAVSGTLTPGAQTSLPVSLGSQLHSASTIGMGIFRTGVPLALFPGTLNINTSAAGHYKGIFVAALNTTPNVIGDQLGSNLILIKDASGNAYWPALEIDDLPEIQAGKTYTIEATAPQVWTSDFIMGGALLGTRTTSGANIGLGLQRSGFSVGLQAVPSLPGDTGRKIVLGTSVDFYVLSPNQVYAETVTLQAVAAVPGGVYSCVFDFGDGNTSNGEQVTNYYRNSGEYSITMTLTSNEAQIFTVTKKLRLYGYRLRFDLVPVSGAIPLTVKFQPVLEAAKP